MNPTNQFPKVHPNRLTNNPQMKASTDTQTDPSNTQIPWQTPQQTPKYVTLQKILWRNFIGLYNVKELGLNRTPNSELPIYSQIYIN